MNNLGGETGGQSYWVRQRGRIMERGRVRVCGIVVQCGFFCGGTVIFVHLWMAWWSASITKS